MASDLANPLGFSEGILAKLGVSPKASYYGTDVQLLNAEQYQEGQWTAGGNYNAQAMRNPLNLETTPSQSGVTPAGMVGPSEVYGSWSDAVAATTSFFQVNDPKVVDALTGQDGTTPGAVADAYLSSIGGWISHATDPTDVAAEAAYGSDIRSDLNVQGVAQTGLDTAINNTRYVGATPTTTPTLPGGSGGGGSLLSKIPGDIGRALQQSLLPGIGGAVGAGVGAATGAAGSGVQNSIDSNIPAIPNVLSGAEQAVIGVAERFALALVGVVFVIVGLVLAAKDEDSNNLGGAGSGSPSSSAPPALDDAKAPTAEEAAELAA